MADRKPARTCIACHQPGARRVVVALVELDVDALPGAKLKRLGGLEILACEACHPNEAAHV